MNGTRTCTLRKHYMNVFIWLFLSRYSILKLGYFLIFDMCHSKSLLLISIVFREGLNRKTHIKKIPTFEYTVHLIHGVRNFKNYMYTFL